MYRKFLSLCLAMALLLSGTTALAEIPMAPKPGELDWSKVMELGRTYLKENAGIEPSAFDAAPVSVDLWPWYGDGVDRAWLVTFAFPDSTDYWFHWVYLSPDTGEVLSPKADEYAAQRISMHDGSGLMSRNWAETKRLEIEKGHYTLWSYEDKAEFYERFSFGPAFSSTCLGMPGANDLPYKEALALAREVIMRETGTTVEDLDDLLVDSSYRPGGWGSDPPMLHAWRICFRTDARDIYGEPEPVYLVWVNSPGGETVLDIALPYKTMPVSASDLSDKLYYNPNGGKHYHANPRCPSVYAEYLPLTEMGKSELSTAAFQKYTPCPVCIIAD